jgi:hypothetical protein
MRALMLLSWKYRNPLSFLVFPFVTDNAIDQCKKREVPAHSDIPSGVNSGAELPHENISRAHRFATEDFHSASLPLAVAAVA